MFLINIYDNLRLASYVSAAEAFNESKNVFLGFIPMVESMLVLSAEKQSISFLALQQKINETFQVKIPKDTLRYLLQTLESQGRIVFPDKKNIFPNKEKLTKEVEDREKALNEIEDFFLKFKDYLNKRELNASSSEIRNYVCEWIYSHSSDLASFIQAGKMSTTLSQSADNDEWSYSKHFIQFLLNSKDENNPEYMAFVKLFDGAVQTSLLNFTPKQIGEVTTPSFKISNVLLDTNFILRLIQLQDPLDCEMAIETWQSLRDNGTEFYVLDQTIIEASSSIRNFLNDNTPYTHQTRQFLSNIRARTSGFLNALQNGLSRTDLLELSEHEALRTAIKDKYSINIIDDYTDSIEENEIESLIQSKGIERYGKPQARHDILLIRYCRKRRPNRIYSIGDAQWWVLTNDKKLTFWNQNNRELYQECITEVQLSNLLWLQAKKDSSAGLSNTIIALASKFASGASDISLYAKLVARYEQKYADNTAKLDTLALVFANNVLTVEDLHSAEDDEDAFEKAVDEKADLIRLKQIEQKAELEKAHNSNADISRELRKLTNNLNKQKKLSTAKMLQRDIADYQKQKEEAEKIICKIDDVSNYSKTCEIPAARWLLVSLCIPLLFILFVFLRYGAKPVYGFITQDLDHFNTLIGVLGCGAVTIFLSLIYYAIIIIVFGAPIKPADLFIKLRDDFVAKKKDKYIVQKRYPSDLIGENLPFLRNQYKKVVEKCTSEIEKATIEYQRIEEEIQAMEL